jgi:hypothetical protein
VERVRDAFVDHVGQDVRNGLLDLVGDLLLDILIWGGDITLLSLLQKRWFLFIFAASNLLPIDIEVVVVLLTAGLEACASVLVGVLAFLSVSVDVSIDAEGSALLDELLGFGLRALVPDGSGISVGLQNLKGHESGKDTSRLSRGSLLVGSISESVAATWAVLELLFEGGVLQIVNDIILIISVSVSPCKVSVRSKVLGEHH